MKTETIDCQKEDQFLTVPQLSQRYPAFSQGSIRWMIFNGEKNGFNKCVRRIGRKCVISLNNFLEWLEEQTA